MKKLSELVKSDSKVGFCYVCSNGSVAVCIKEGKTSPELSEKIRQLLGPDVNISFFFDVNKMGTDDFQLSSPATTQAIKMG